MGRGIYGIIFRTVSRRIPGGEGFYLKCFLYISDCDHAMYEALSNMGLESGNVLEPSCGVGNFMGLVPKSMEDLKMYGVELDSISGRIAKQLYQKNNISVQGFETAQYPDSFFDCVIGNVPFGSYKVADRKYDRHNFMIHDYFIAKSLDLVRPAVLWQWSLPRHTG